MKKITTIILLILSMQGYSQQTIKVAGGGGTSGSTFNPDTLEAAIALKMNIAPIIQTITSGTTATVTDSTTWFIINPVSVLTSFTLTMPTSPYNGKVVSFSFGGTITATAESVVNTFTVVPNAGQGIIGQTVFYSVETDNHFTFKYNSSLSKWYRL